MSQGSNTVTLAGLAKEIFPISEIKAMEQVNTTLYKEIPEKRNLDYSAKDGGSFTFPVKAFGPHGQKMMNEQEALAKGKSSNVVQGKSFVKEYAGVLQFTKRELELAKGDVQSFANAKTFEMENLIINAHKYFNRQVANGDGHGTMTLVTGGQTVAAGNPINVDDATMFQIGQVIDIFDAAGTVKAVDQATVTDIDILSTQNTITLDIDVVVADNGIICISGVRDNASTDGKEMIGLPLVVDDGTLQASFQNIPRTGVGAVYNYRGITLDASSAPISVSLINQLTTRAYRISGVDFVTSNDAYFLFSPEQWRAYSSLATPQIRFMPSDAPDLNKQFTQYECMGKRVVLDTDVSRTRVYLMKKSAVSMAIPTALDWESDLGGTTLKWLSGTTQGVMVLYSLLQMFSQAPRDAAAITSLATVEI